jgi:hypothetical protein
MPLEGGQERWRCIDRWTRLAVLGVMTVGVSGLALAASGYWEGHGWAVVLGYALAAPLMLIYPAIMLALAVANWRRARRERRRAAPPPAG